MARRNSGCTALSTGRLFRRELGRHSRIAPEIWDELAGQTAPVIPNFKTFF